MPSTEGGTPTETARDSRLDSLPPWSRNPPVVHHLRMRPVAVHRLGRVGYASSQALQRSLAAQVRSGVRGDTLLLLEHPPVFTLGRVQQSAANVLASPEEIAAAGASVHQSERGGNVTFHGPGQLVAYPILDLGRFRKSVHWYVEAARPAGGGGLRAPRFSPAPSFRVGARGYAHRHGRRLWGVCEARRRRRDGRLGDGPEDWRDRRVGLALGHLARRRAQRGDGPPLLRHDCAVRAAPQHESHLA